MRKQEMEDRINQLTNRNIGRLFTKLDEIHTAEIIKDTIKKHFWFLAGDIKRELSEEDHEQKFNSNL